MNKEDKDLINSGFDILFNFFYYILIFYSVVSCYIGGDIILTDLIIISVLFVILGTIWLFKTIDIIISIFTKINKTKKIIVLISIFIFHIFINSIFFIFIIFK